MGYGNVKENIQYFQKERCSDNFCFRVTNGTAVGVAGSVIEDLLPNSWHFSKDVIETGFTSFILPKRSPLKVTEFFEWLLYHFA